MGFGSTLHSGERLIVLLPDCMADNMALAHQIHRMAARENLEVFYLALIDDDEQSLTISRWMATLTAVTSANYLTVNFKTSKTDSWFRALKEIYRPGDRIVCHKEHEMNAGSWRRRARVSDVLQERLKASVIILSGYYQPEPAPGRRWLQGILTWAGFLVILAFFAWLGFQLELAVQGPAGTILLVLVVCVEFGMLWAWNKISYMWR